MPPSGTELEQGADGEGRCGLLSPPQVCGVLDVGWGHSSRSCVLMSHLPLLCCSYLMPKFSCWEQGAPEPQGDRGTLGCAALSVPLPREQEPGHHRVMQGDSAGQGMGGPRIPRGLQPCWHPCLTPHLSPSAGLEVLAVLWPLDSHSTILFLPPTPHCTLAASSSHCIAAV